MCFGARNRLQYLSFYCFILLDKNQFDDFQFEKNKNVKKKTEWARKRSYEGNQRLLAGRCANEEPKWKEKLWRVEVCFGIWHEINKSK